jgi:hypothetical protein
MFSLGCCIKLSKDVFHYDEGHNVDVQKIWIFILALVHLMHIVLNLI